MSKIRDFVDYSTDRLKEPSTWQGIGFVVSLTGSHFGAGMDWGQAAGLGGVISAAIKVVTPDPKPKDVP